MHKKTRLTDAVRRSRHPAFFRSIAVTLHSFPAAALLHWPQWRPKIEGSSGICGRDDRPAAPSKLAAIFTQLFGALSQILSRTR
jgi:hypothetical protein